MSIVLTLVLLPVCIAGLFTNFGYERCACNDLRGWFTMTILAILAMWGFKVASKG